MATFTIAEGQLVVDADTKAADKELDGFERRTDARLRDARGRFVKAGTEAGRGFRDGLEREVGRGGGIGGIFGRMFGGGRDGGGLGGFFKGMFSGLAELGGAGLKGIGDLFSSGLGKAREMGKMFQDLGNLAGGIGGAVMAVAQIAALAAAIPVVLALGGAILQMTAALLAVPAAVAVVLAIFAPLMIAIKGVSGALSAFASGDMTKFNEELKKMGPGARAATRELTSLIGPFRELGKFVTNAFWTPLVGSIKPLIHLVSTLKTGMGGVATELGKVAAKFFELMASNDILEAIGDIFESAGRIVAQVGPSIVRFIGTMIGIIEHGLPYVERFFGWVSRGIDGLTEWLSGLMKTGDFEKHLDRAVELLSDVWDLAKAVGELFMTIFGEFGSESGEGIIESLTRMTKEFTAFFKSADGKEMIDNMKKIVGAVIWVIDHLADFYTAIWKFYNFLGDVWRGARGILAGVILWVQDAAGKVADFFRGVGDWFSDLGTKIKNGATALWDWVTGAGQGFLDWITSLPGAIMDFITSIPGRLAELFVQLFDLVTYGLGFALGLLVSMPRRIWEIVVATWNFVTEAAKTGWDNTLAFITSIPERLASMWETAKTLTMEAWNALMAWITSLPEKMAEAWANLKTWASDTWNGMWTAAREATISGFNATLTFVKEMPGKIKDVFKGAKDWLFEVGKDIWRGLGDGLRSMIDWAVGVAKRAAKNVVEGFKDGFKIGSPSKLMEDEVGRWLLPGLMRPVERGMPAAMRDLAGVSASMAAASRQAVVNVAAPNVAVGGPSLAVYLDSREIAHQVVVAHPSTMAAATAEGSRRRSYLNTGRPATVSA